MELTTGSENQTMSSKEIAKLTGKLHHNVTRDIEKMLKTLDIEDASFLTHQKTYQNREIKSYNLPKRETLILVSGYNVKLRTKIIDRWQELENMNMDSYMIPNPITRAKAWIVEQEKLQLAMDTVKSQAKRIELDKPKVEFAKRFADSNGNYSIGSLAKILNIKNVGRNNMFKLLRNNSVFMKDNIPYQRYIKSEYFKVVIAEKNGMNFKVPVATPKGLMWVEKNINKWI